MILDTILLFAGLIIYLIAVGWRQATPTKQSLKGAKIIVKARTTTIHCGDCFDVVDNTAYGRKDDGSYFVANISKLFWSEDEQAYVERV